VKKPDPGGFGGDYVDYGGGVGQRNRSPDYAGFKRGDGKRLRPATLRSLRRSIELADADVPIKPGDGLRKVLGVVVLEKLPPR